MIKASTHMPNAVGRAAAVVVAIAATTTMAMAPAAAKPAKDRSGRATSTIQDVSGLQVVRTWKIAADDPGTLTGSVHVQNTNTAPVTTTLLEPLPIASLKKAKFAPKKVKVTLTPGLARVDLTVPSGGEVDFGYTALLTKDKKAKAQDRLATVQGEMDAALAIAQPTDPDRALAAMKGRYVGTLAVTELSASGLENSNPSPPPPATIILLLTPTPNCQVVSRGCHFTARDSYTREPKLAALDPAGNSLTASAAADLEQSGLTCDGANAPGVNTKNWTFEPTAWHLSWAGWEVTQGRYTIVSDLTSPDNGVCFGASVHMVTTGMMTG
jgi:hypothetical protein